MNKEDILKCLQQEQTTLDTLEVESLMLFGSAARSEAQETSDLDFLVRFKSPPTFDMYMDLKFFLEDLLERPVDLVTADAVREQIRPSIMREGIYVT